MAKIHEIISDVNRGEIVLPEFQRGYVWSRDQVREFVKSLYKERPTGHLLEWHAYRPVAIRGGSGKTDTKKRLLLDGQQRLTSLYVLFKGVPPPFYEGESLFFDLFFNVQTEEFHFWQKSLMANNPMWRSVHENLREGLATLLSHIDDLADEEQAAIRSNLRTLSLLDRIRDYDYTVDTLKDESLTVDDVVTIFNNVNSGGTTLSRADLAMAHVCTEWPEARAELRDFATQMGHVGFRVEPDMLIRAVAGTADGAVAFTPAFYNVPADALRTAWPKVKTSFENLVNDLAHHAFIDSIADLTTPLVLVPVLVFLARRGGSFGTAAERDRFIRWMFLANIWSRYAGQTDTRLLRDVKIVLEDDEPTARLEEEILRDRGRIRLEARDLEGKGPQTAIYKFAYVVARWQGAVDWFTGTTLYSKAIGKSYGLESHHIFPKDVLKRNGFESRESQKLVNEVANRAFLTRRANRTISNKNPITYLPKVERDFPGALKAQYVPTNSELWKVANYEEFLYQRRTQLAKSMNQLLDRWSHGERAPVDDIGHVAKLLERDEAQDLEFKSSLRTDVPGGELNKALEKTVLKTVAGFLNANGGTLLVGVSDDRRPLGLEPDYLSLQKEGRDVRDTFQLHLTNILMKTLGEPALAFVTVTCHDLKGKDICQVVVAACDHPIYLTEGDTSTFYLRIGPQTRALSLQHTVRYVASHWGDGPKGWMPPIEELDEVSEAEEEEPESAEGWVADSSAFVEAIDRAPLERRPELRRLADWAAALESQGLVEALWSFRGKKPRLLAYPRGESSGLVTIWEDASLALWRGVFERCAPESIPSIEEMIAPVELGRGFSVRRVPDKLLEALTAAYREAANNAPERGADSDGASGVPAMDRVLRAAEEAGTQPILEEFLALGTRLGLHVRAWRKSLMFAPMRDKKRALFTIWANGSLGIWSEALEEFYPHVAESARGTLEPRTRDISDEKEGAAIVAQIEAVLGPRDGATA